VAEAVEPFEHVDAWPHLFALNAEAAFVVADEEAYRG
jgi:hypothetical protein